jgi:hypothetical protein
MNIFLIGLPKSGSEKIAEALTQDGSRRLIDASSWVKDTFREQKVGEHIEQYQDEYNAYLTKRLLVNPYFIMDNVYDIMKSYESDNKPFVINGLSSPKDFTHLFDYRTDVVVFLNRTDNDADVRDHENIAISCMRDYCFYLAAHNLIPKSRWLEYNFKISGEESEFVKTLGSKNSVFIVKSLSRVITHLQETLKNIVVVTP